MEAERPFLFNRSPALRAFGFGCLFFQVCHQVLVLAGFPPGQNFSYSYCIERVIQSHDGIELKGLVPNAVRADFVILVRLFGPFLHVDILSDAFGASGKAGHGAAYYFGRCDNTGTSVTGKLAFPVPIQDG